MLLLAKGILISLRKEILPFFGKSLLLLSGRTLRKYIVSKGNCLLLTLDKFKKKVEENPIEPDSPRAVLKIDEESFLSSDPRKRKITIPIYHPIPLIQVLQPRISYSKAISSNHKKTYYPSYSEKVLILLIRSHHPKNIF